MSENIWGGILKMSHLQHFMTYFADLSIYFLVSQPANLNIFPLNHSFYFSETT